MPKGSNPNDPMREVLSRDLPCLIETGIDGWARLAHVEDGVDADEYVRLYERIRIEFKAAGWRVSVEAEQRRTTRQSGIFLSMAGRRVVGKVESQPVVVGLHDGVVEVRRRRRRRRRRGGESTRRNWPSVQE